MKRRWIKKFPSTLLVGRGRSRKMRSMYSVVSRNRGVGIGYRKRKKSWWSFR